MATLSICICSLVYLVLLEVTYSGVTRRDAYLKETRRNANKEQAGNEEKDERVLNLLEHKSQINFKCMDLNHDKIMNIDDLSIQANVFINVYNLSGSEEVRIRKQLYRAMSCILFNGFDTGGYISQFVAQIIQAYRKNKFKIIQQYHECVDDLVDLLDFDENGFISIDELAVFFKSINMGNRKLIEERYKMICPDTYVHCPVQNVSESMTDIIIGNDEKAFDARVHVFEEIGIPLDDLVE